MKYSGPKTDKSTHLSPGKLRKKAGSNATAGNSVKSSSVSAKFSGNKVEAVSKLATRFKKTRTRRG